MYQQNGKIQLATEKDIANIVKLNQQFHIELTDFKWDQPRWVKEEIQKGHYYVYLSAENLILGALDIEVDGIELFIEAIAIDPRSHGRGIGRKLITFAKQTAQQYGYQVLRVESFESYGLLEFYQKVGFVLDTPRTGSYRGKLYYRFVMTL